MNKSRFFRFATAAALGALSLSQAVHAALPEAVSTEVATYKTDMLALLALCIAAGVAVWGAKKLGQKMGWL
nr:hypothetical protein [uncultured Albidiferax sp.]